MKKEYLPTLLIIILLIFCLIYYYLFFGNEKNDKTQIKVNVVPTLISKLEDNSIWCSTFQLIWNDLKDEIVKDDVVLLNDENNQTVLDLNKKTFTANDISDKYYYKKHGFMTLDLKHEIEKNIMEKFQEKSDILDSMYFEPNSKNYLLYTMLYRKFEFNNPFDILDDYNFGINNQSDSKLDNNVKVLFYDDYNNYAVKIETKDNDELILIKGKNDKDNFLEIYNELNLINQSNFLNDDTISISNFNFSLITNYEELENKIIKNTDFVISNAIQTVNFNLDNKGGKVKSEAAITFKNTSVGGRSFNFTDNYVLFLKEKEKDKPYFAMKIDNIEKFR